MADQLVSLQYEYYGQVIVYYLIQQSSMENNKSTDQIKKFARRSMSPVQFMSTTEFKSKQKIGPNINFCFMPSTKIEELKLKKKGYSEIRKNINQSDEKTEDNSRKQDQGFNSFDFTNVKLPNFDDRQKKDMSCDTEVDRNFQQMSFIINNSEPSRQLTDPKLVEKIKELQAINQQKTVIINRQAQQLLIVQKSLKDSLKRQQQQRQQIRKLHLLLLVQQRRNQEILGQKKKMIAQHRRKERVNDERRNRTLKENRSYNDNLGSKNQLFYLSPDKFEP